MGALKSKLPLIIIVAHKSCIVNTQIRVGDSKYGTFNHTILTPRPHYPPNPQILHYKIQIVVFLLGTHCSRHHIDAHCAKHFFTQLGYGAYLTKHNFQDQN